MSKEAMKLALEALENSIDLVEEDYANAVNLYGKYPSRAQRLIGMETMRDDHRKAITALREALAQQPAQQEPFAYAFTGIKQNGEHHGPHLVWKPEYMDAMSASMGAVAVPLYTSPPASKPHGFAGVTAWIGDATVTQIVTQVRIQREREAGQAITQAAQTCLDMLAAHGIKGDA